MEHVVLWSTEGIVILAFYSKMRFCQLVLLDKCLLKAIKLAMKGVGS